MIDFMILYEIATREWDNILILGNELKRRGYTVEYMQLGEVSKNNYIKNNRKLKKYRNNVKVLLVPSFYHDKEMLDYFYYPFGRVEKIVNLRWEQYYVNEVMDNPKEHLYLYPCESGRNAYHVCWGNVSHQNMIEIGISEDRLIDSGPLHMDILRDEFRDRFKTKSELLSQYKLDSNREMVLFISSFANATDKSSYHSYIEKFFSGNYRFDNSRIALEQSSYHLALEWFDDFLEINKDIVFIYRPHPSELVTEKLKKLEEKYDNFIVSTDYSVKQWILASDILVTWMSTAIIEAYFANKACFIIRPVDFPIEKDMCVYKDAKFISSEEEFLRITKDSCKNSLSEKYVYQCYGVDAVNPSYIRLSDSLETIINNQDKFPWDNKLIKKFEITKPLLIAKCFGNVVKSKAKKIIIGLMLSIKKITKISYGKRIEEKLKVRAINK